MKHIELIRILRTYNFFLVRNSGHFIYSNGTTSIAIPHRNEFSRGLLRRIFQQMGLTKDQIKEHI